ncbi:hypothetical protein C8J56DRAFT_1071311 [Mycena floridula]|nr:hypothetical protein C8J56DRAFT_1071311 [Mycena floridula]
MSESSGSNVVAIAAKKQCPLTSIIRAGSGHRAHSFRRRARASSSILVGTKSISLMPAGTASLPCVIIERLSTVIAFSSVLDIVAASFANRDTVYELVVDFNAVASPPWKLCPSRLCLYRLWLKRWMSLMNPQSSTIPCDPRLFEYGPFLLAAAPAPICLESAFLGSLTSTWLAARPSLLLQDPDLALWLQLRMRNDSGGYGMTGFIGALIRTSGVYWKRRTYFQLGYLVCFKLEFHRPLYVLLLFGFHIALLSIPPSIARIYMPELFSSSAWSIVVSWTHHLGRHPWSSEDRVVAVLAGGQQAEIGRQKFGSSYSGIVGSRRKTFVGYSPRPLSCGFPPVVMSST